MTVFLVIIVLALLAVTGWQMSKIFQLSKGPGAESAEIANDNDNRQQAKLMLGFMIFLYVGMAYSFWHWSRFYLPEAASEHGNEVDTLMFISIGLIMVVQVITQALLHWFAYKYQGKKGNRALFFADNDTNRGIFIW